MLPKPYMLAGLAAMALWVQPAAAQRSARGDCSLTVDGRTYLDIKRTCPIEFLDKEGSFTINTRNSNKPFHFAYVLMNGDGTANASWNADPRGTHAHDILGDDFRREGGCWANRRAKICAYRR